MERLWICKFKYKLPSGEVKETYVKETEISKFQAKKKKIKAWIYANNYELLEMEDKPYDI